MYLHIHICTITSLYVAAAVLKGASRYDVQLHIYEHTQCLIVVHDISSSCFCKVP